MEVKIKNSDNTLVDADWTIKDDVMVVSPKEVKFEPKDGDVIVCSNALGCWTLIVKTIEPRVVYHHAVLVDNGILKINNRSAYTNPRFATEEEKQKLFDKLAEEGLEWKADTKELVKLKWKPYEGGDFYLPCYHVMKFAPIKGMFNIGRDKSFLDKGWCFKTKEECQEFCKRLNEVINSLKP